MNLNYTEISYEIRQMFRLHNLYVPQKLGEHELLCNCTEPGCDAEIIDIAGAKFSGICRTYPGGVCRRLEHYDTNEQLVKRSFSCMHRQELIPPEKPFVCQNVTTTRFTQVIHCCSSHSFCNIENIPSHSLEFFLWQYFILLLFVFVLFALAVLFIGFYREKLKTIIITRLRNSSHSRFPRLEKLLYEMEPDPEPTSGGSSSTPIPILANRTISRQITLKQQIGNGRFGSVHIGEWRGEKVAVKIINSLDEGSWNRETEVYRTNMLRHSNLLRWIASDNKDTGLEIQLWIVTEYLPNGSLYDYLTKNTLTSGMALQFIRSIAHGLSYLHTELAGISLAKPGIAHCDFKSKNILIKNDMTCVIADLGNAVRGINGEVDVPPHSRCGTIRYLAPEYLMKTMTDKFNAYAQLDVYAFGLVIWEICWRMKIDHEKSSPYMLPYSEHVPRNPTFDQMHQCVVMQGKRPTIKQTWWKVPMLAELVRIHCESTHQDPNSRLTPLNIRYSIDELIKCNNIKIVT